MIIDLAAWRAQQTPDRPAVRWRGDWLSYAELDRRARQLAARLHAEGVRRGDRVAILAHNHVAHLDLVLAAPKLGFVYTPLNYRLSASEQTATDSIPSSLHARITRTAISPRLAIRILFKGRTSCRV